MAELEMHKGEGKWKNVTTNSPKVLANEVKHYQVNQRYRVVFEQAASTKGVTGFKCEVTGDDFNEVQEQAEAMLQWAQKKAPQAIAEVKEKEK